MRLLLDHNVPDSVGRVFQSRGHQVRHVRDILPIDSPDPLIATVSEEDGDILVSCDRDFKLIAPAGLPAQSGRELASFEIASGLFFISANSRSEEEPMFRLQFATVRQPL
jgi:hypothetical protein